MSVIKRIWFKCKADADHVWYDDGGNSFGGCPECGADFDILDEETITEKTRSEAGGE